MLNRASSFLLLAIALTFILGTSGTHFRGGSLTWSVPENSYTVTFTLQSYWSPEKVENDFNINFGVNGLPVQQIHFPIVSSTSEFVTVGGTFNHTFSTHGSYTVFFSDCCRIIELRASSEAPFKVSTNVILKNKEYRVSPVISIPPIVHFGVGSNELPVLSSVVLNTIAFSTPDLSGFMQPFSGSQGAPKIALVKNQKEVSILSWKTSAQDVGLWPVQIKATTSFGHVVADFLIQVHEFPVTSNPSTFVLSPPQSKYGLTTGETVEFDITCSSEAENQFSLSTPAVYPGLTMGGVAQGEIQTNSGVAVPIRFTPVISNGARNQAFVLTFVCKNKETYASVLKSVTVSVGDPLVLTPPPSATIPCYKPCGCIEDIGEATATDGCCGNPIITYTDAKNPNGSCKTSFDRTWTASNACGQTVTAVQKIYVDDSTPPEFGDYLPEDEYLTCINQVTQDDSDVFASDTCSDVTITIHDHKSAGDSSCDNTITRKFIASDACGNNATHTQVINVKDDVPPYIFKAGEGTQTKVECNSNVNYFDGYVRAFDNCDEAEITWTDSPQNLTKCGKFTRTFKATDACGNAAELPFEFEIGHTHKPTITPPAGIPPVPQCCADVGCLPSPTAKSYCGADLGVYIASPTTFTKDNKCCTAAVRYFGAQDECGNVATYEQTITIKDTTKPNVYAPEDVTKECVYGSQCYSPCDSYYGPEYTGYATGDDNCNQDVIVNHTDTVQTPTCKTIITRRWTVTDTCGNSDYEDQTITIVDTTAPDYCPPGNHKGVCPADKAGAPKPQGIVDCHDTTSTSKDVIKTQGPGKCTDEVIERTWTVSDECGNSKKTIQTITIEDKVKPVLNVPCDTTVDCITKIDVSYTGTAWGSDNCGQDVTITHRDVNLTGTNKMVREWTATDVCGNKVSKNQTITFENDKPDMTCPDDAYVDCIESIHPDKTGHAIAADKCNGTIIPTYQDVTQSTCPTVITRTWTAYNPITKQTETCAQAIYVNNEKRGPHITGPPDVTVECEDLIDPEITGTPCSAALCPSDEIQEATYEDLAEGQKCQHGRKLTRTWTVSDQCGFKSTATQIIHIWDGQKPTIYVPKDLHVYCRLNITDCGIAHGFDNCDKDVKVTYKDDYKPNATFCPARIIRTHTATDCSGNNISKTQTITIEEDAPQFIGYPSADLGEIECEDCFERPTLRAIDSCGKEFDAVPSVSKSGTCPTIITITHTATDDCGRTATFVQTLTVRDVTPPTIVVYSVEDIVVECASDIPSMGVVASSDNCPGIKPATFVDTAVKGNCTCEDCSKKYIRTWQVKDKCGLVSAPVHQNIIVAKTKPPTLVLPKNYTDLKCGAPYTPDCTGTGTATATDSCGTKLLVTHTDKVVTLPNGDMSITRTWTTTDDCGRSATGVQTIYIKSGRGIKFYIPADAVLPCGASLSVDDDTGGYYNKPSVSSPCGEMTLSHHLPDTCPETQGLYVREWTAYRNGVPVQTKEQILLVDDCPPRGHGIINTPASPVRLDSAQADIKPTITIIDPDFPCETITINWDFGDGTKATVVCEADSLSSNCKFSGNQLITSTSHKYTTAGVHKITALITGKRYVPADSVYAEHGPSHTTLSVNVIVIDPYTGSVSGDVDLLVLNKDGGSTYGGKCKEPWIVKAAQSYTGLKQMNIDCGGSVDVTFSAKYVKNGDDVIANGETKFSWATCIGGIYFNSINLTHLTLFADGRTALWTGFGTFNIVPNVELAYTFIAVDGGHPGYVGDYVHLRVSDLNGNVVLDTDPCLPPITDITVLPQTPSSYMLSSSSGIVVNNPTDETISALGSEGVGTSGNVPVGLIVGIVLGLMAFIVAVAVVVYLLLKRSSVAQQPASSDKFIAM